MTLQIALLGETALKEVVGLLRYKLLNEGMNAVLMITLLMKRMCTMH
jgi:hypothetical protein